MEPAASDNTEPWTRVRLNAERLDWVAPYFAGLGRDLFIEEPAELREQVRVVAGRLLAACGDDPSKAVASSGPGSTPAEASCPSSAPLQTSTTPV
ncbi:WYL domain-containing protein [Rhodococcus sp. NBC_00297]|uniref:WYL domain-containing protein n=1 Tax=Rhodococcus sp. NBC_00297 TaxID=2976005 RepID=UPI002E2E7D70|nr:WYL domain-containing protein [Rhodococcus sp. NBC_00297]